MTNLGASQPYARQESPHERRKEKKAALKQIIFLAAILGIVLAVTSFVLKPFFPSEYLLYFQVAEVAIIGFFAIQITANISYRLSLVHSEQTAKSIKSVVRIAGAIIVIAFIVSYLSADPVIAASITTISGLVIGFASANIIGNAIAGIYLAISRPFRIGDRIKVFGELGRVYDIGLLYSRLVLDNGDHMLASNSSMITTTVVLKIGKEDKEPEWRAGRTSSSA